jgi:hypothetical protein
MERRGRQGCCYVYVFTRIYPRARERSGQDMAVISRCLSEFILEVQKGVGRIRLLLCLGVYPNLS